ncbi:MAG TPA: hypothetical protein VFN03_05280 [Trueperaceae bacterium]|nr:hypothetical protein [Trueperaceae bacterium]
MAAVVVAGVVMSSATAQPAQPLSPRDPAFDIAFIDPTGHVAVVDPRSVDPLADVTGFGTGRQLAIFPAWSSDGNRLAAVTATPQGSRVEVIDVAKGGRPLVVLDAADRGPIYLNWSPDARYLAVLSSTPDSALALDFIDVATEPGSEVVRTTLAFGQPFYWVWSATGRSVLVHRDVLRRTAVVGISAIAEFDVRQPLPSPGAFQAPDISDSGRYVAYASMVGAENYVVVAGNPERGSNVEPVVRLAQRGMVAFGWRPGHEQLSVQGATSEGSFTGELELLDVLTGVSTVLSANEVVASFWSPDGRWIAALSRRTGSEEVIVARGPDLTDVQRRVLRLDLDLIEADTRQVVEHGPVTVSVAFASQYLPFFDQYSRSHSLWAPDSSALVLPEIGPSGAPRLVILDTDGGRTYLVDGDMPAWNVR